MDDDNEKKMKCFDLLPYFGASGEDFKSLQRVQVKGRLIILYNTSPRRVKLKEVL